MRMRLVTLLALSFILFASALSEAGTIRRNALPVDGSYIVVLKTESTELPSQAGAPRPGVAEVARDMVVQRGLGLVTRVYEKALRGFAVRMSRSQAEVLANDPRVAFVEENGIVHTMATQQNATWGLDRIDQRSLPLSSTYEYNRTGAGVHAYIIDTGMRVTHQEFSGRVGSGFSAVEDGYGTNDCHGHGTHVAGTVGGTTWGVAKLVSLYPVRVLNCLGSGTIEGVVAGVDWVTANHSKPAVANMSLGGGSSQAMDLAVENSVKAGVTYVIAAGNSNADACFTSPGSAPSAITVGASDNTDTRAGFSNWGACLDIFAPGMSVTSSWNSSDTATNNLSGTSMATPHVTGVAALYLQLNPKATPAQVTQAILVLATADVVSNPSDSPNLLLYSLFPGPPMNESFNSASYRSEPLGADSIVSAFGQNLANTTAQAGTVPLPTNLGGTTVTIRDSSGAERLAGLFYVSPGQVNYHMPPALASGWANVTVRSGDGMLSVGAANIAAVGPGLYSANSNGAGLASASVYRVKEDGTGVWEAAVRFERFINKYVPVPIDLSNPAEQVYLILYGTGVRGYKNSVSVLLNGSPVVPSYAGAQGYYVGLDQINVLLPRTLSGAGVVTVNIVVDGKTANSLEIKIQ